MAVPHADRPVELADDVIDLASHGLVVSDRHRRGLHVVLAGELGAPLDAVPPLAVGVERQVTRYTILGLTGGARPRSRAALELARRHLDAEVVRFAGYGSNGDLGYDPPAGTRIAVYCTDD